MLYVMPWTLLLDRKFRVLACGSKTLVHCRLHMNEGLTDCSAFFVDSEGEEDDEQDNEPRDRVEVAEARDVFGESDEEGDQEPEQDQEVEERQTPEESLQGSPEVRTVS